MSFGSNSLVKTEHHAEAEAAIAFIRRQTSAIRASLFLCGGKPRAASQNAALFEGLGAWATGYLADRFGRRAAILVALLSSTALYVAAAFSTNYGMFFTFFLLACKLRTTSLFLNL